MNRVAVTGMGVVSPLGNSVPEFRDKLLSCASGISRLSLFPPASLPVRIAGQCAISEVSKDRKAAFAGIAADAAIEDAGREGKTVFAAYDPHHRGLSIGIGLELFDMDDLAALAGNGFEIPEEKRGRADFLQTPSDLCVDILVRRFGLLLPPGVHISACAAGSDAIGHAFLRIRRGEARMMLAGGTDSMLNPMGLGGFCKLNALSTRNDNPEQASRPFDAARDGFVLAEGAGMLVLENFDSAVQRGARIYGELAGYGNSFDAYSVSDPHPEGLGACLAMERALKMAGISPQEISYINAHGTSTPKNDAVETLAIKKVFGDHAYKMPVSSTKSMIGHLISAAGAVEMVASIACAASGFIHPTRNVNNPDPACDLDYVPDEARCYGGGYLMSNSFAFGGQNASLVVRSFTNGDQ